MDQRVQLKHPRRKKAVAMPREKYDLLKPAVLRFLSTKKSATFGEISAAIKKHFKKKGIVFQGSIPWHLEWVKLDLEARKIIKRVSDTSTTKYVIR